jgi:hypothetical protein
MSDLKITLTRMVHQRKSANQQCEGALVLVRGESFDGVDCDVAAENVSRERGVEKEY